MRDIFAQKMANDTMFENNSKKSYNLNFRAKNQAYFWSFFGGKKPQKIFFPFLKLLMT